MIACPKTEGQLKIAYKDAREAGKAILPFGLGHSLQGRLEAPDLAAISSRALKEAGSVEPDNLLAEAGAGLTVSELEKVLAPAGLYWPVTGPAERTLGGIMGQGLLGAETMAKGLMTNWVLGARVFSPSGEFIRSGGKTLKNVSGYDMTRLAWRARGSLVMSVSFVLKLLPRPEICPVMEFSIKSLKDAAARMAAIITGRFGAQSLRLIGDQHGLRIAVWMTGFTALVTEQENKLKKLLKDPVDLFEDGFEYYNHADTIFNIPDPNIRLYAGPRKSLLEFIADLSWIGDFNFTADIGGGRVALRSPPEEIKRCALYCGLVLISGDVFSAAGPLFRRVKAAVDPESVFMTL